MTDDSPPSFTDFATLLTSRSVSPGQLLFDVPDGWQQGRGAFGGLVLGALARAMEMSEPEADRKLRALNGEIAGPVQPGEANIEVTELRRGNGLSSFSATLRQAGRALARASAVFARARGAAQSKLNLPRPAPPPWRDVPPAVMELETTNPTFVRHFEMRPTGPLPFTGSSGDIASGWVRPKRMSAPLGAAHVVALVDCWWPASLNALTAFRPVATVSFSVQVFLPSAPLDNADPLYYQGRILADQDGYMNEMRELWTARGDLLALNQQTIAWIK